MSQQDTLNSVLHCCFGVLLNRNKIQRKTSVDCFLFLLFLYPDVKDRPALSPSALRDGPLRQEECFTPPGLPCQVLCELFFGFPFDWLSKNRDELRAFQTSRRTLRRKQECEYRDILREVNRYFHSFFI